MSPTAFSPHQIALVSGGAGGIGRATADRFLQAGVGVALVDIHDGVHQVVQELSAQYPELTVESFVADTTDEDSLSKLMADVEAKVERLDHLAVVAGVIQNAAPVENMPLDEWNRVIGVNLTGTMLLCKWAIPLIRKSGGGTITNIASFWGREGRPLFSAYCVSKSAVFTITQSLAAELAPDIRVNTVAPGNINTSMHTTALQDEADKRGVTFEEMKGIEWGKIPLKVAGEPATIADAVVFLASPGASYITGASLDVNGGVFVH